MKDKIDQNPRQIELFEKYYNIDKENKIISITMHYEKASDILNINLGNPNKPLFSLEVLKNISNIISNTPYGYKVELCFEIADYESYSPEIIIESFNDSLELNQYSARNHRQRKEFLSGILILIGIILLLILVLGRNLNWFINSLRNSIIEEVLNITAWVFVWEAVTQLFLTYSEQGILSISIRKKVERIKMLKKGNIEPLAIENSNEIFSEWVNEALVKRIGKIFTLISGFLFLFLAFFTMYNFLSLSFSDTINNEHYAIFSIITITSTILYLLAGIGGILLYRDLNKNITKYIGLYTILLSIGVILSLTTAILIHNVELLIISVVSIIVDIIYVIGYLIDKRK